MRESVGQVPKEQVALSLRRLCGTRTASTSSLRLREVGRERPMSASARGAGSRLEHEDSTARAAPVAGECEVLVRIKIINNFDQNHQQLQQLQRRSAAQLEERRAEVETPFLLPMLFALQSARL